MKFLIFLSEISIPLILFYIVGFGILMKCRVYEEFVKGAKDGLLTVVKILPTLIGLMVAVGVLRASGFLDMLGQVLGNFTAQIGFPSELVPLAIIRMFSSSAATGLVLDIFKNYGPDSFIGRLVSIMFGCTESIFYTMSVYFMSIKIKNSRYTVVGALLASLVGITMSYLLTVYLFGV